jgi:aminopeptidase
MKDPRMAKLAKILINYSTKLRKGENVLIEGYDIPDEMIIELVKEAKKAGANPLVSVKRNRIMREIIKGTDKKHMTLAAESEKLRMKKMDAYIGIRGSHNISELSDVSSGHMEQYQTHWLKPVHFDIRVPKTKWVVLRYPTSSMAQQAGMSTEEFEEFFYKVCTLDYSKMNKAMNPLKKLLEKTDKVRITGPGTDLEFSIKGIPVIKCAGELNIPDGEIFTAPVKNSVNGTISYNTPTIYHGTEFKDIKLTFKNGKIVEAVGSDTKKLNAILDSDNGSRYIGEFALGVNPYITKAMTDILFDEKIRGSIHFTPGNSYDEAPNGNSSKIHWDMVLIQTKAYGGGEIYFDGKLIRKNGDFVPKSLQGLNPKNLK